MVPDGDAGVKPVDWERLAARFLSHPGPLATIPVTTGHPDDRKQPLQSEASGTPIGSEIEDCYVSTVNVDAGLEVAELELLPPAPPTERPQGDAR
jgi:hypothetical protein